MVSLFADIAFVVLGLAIVFISAKRGFLKTVIHFLKFILAFLAAHLWGNAMAGVLSENVIAPPVKGYIYDSLYEKYMESAENFGVTQAIDSFPSFLMTDSVKAGLATAQGTGEELLQNMTDSIANPIVSIFSNIAGYVIVFVIALLLLGIGAAILSKLLEAFGLFGRLNTILGAVLGVASALTVMLAISSLLKFFFGNTEFYTDSAVISLFGDSSVLEGLSFLDIGKTLVENLFDGAVQ